MKKRITQLLALVVATCLLCVPISNAATTNPYNIQYSGGTPLSSSNVNIDPDLINSLDVLAASGATATTTFSTTGGWERGYINVNNTCTSASFLRASKDNSANHFNGAYYTVSNEDFNIVVNVRSVHIDNAEETLEDSDRIIVAVTTGGLYTFYNAYTDETCENIIPEIKHFRARAGMKAFVETNIKLYRKDTNTIFNSNELYFALTDVDGGQSYKVLNTNNLLTSSSMYASSEEALQPQDISLRNMFVSDGNYIYSEHEDTGFNLTGDNDIYLKVNPAIREEGLNVIFGYAGAAASGISFYSKHYTVNYTSDEHGVISGIESEDVMSGYKPSGSTSTPNERYEFTHWVADVDVRLLDINTVRAGYPLTSNEVKQVVVDKNITFTAIHEPILYTYTLTFDANGGENAPTAQRCTTTSTSCTVTIPNTIPTRDGYIFKGWANSSTASAKEYDPNSIITLTADKTVYAVWEAEPAPTPDPVTFTLTFDANGGENAPAAESCTTTSTSCTVTIPNTIPTRDGYIFKGWANSSTASAKDYDPNSTVTLTADKTVYAVWEAEPAPTPDPVTFTLTFDANGGENAPAAESCTTTSASCTVTIPSTVPTRDRYIFKGWANSEIATTKDYDPNSTVTLTADKTVYAVWEAEAEPTPDPVTFTLTFDANGGENAPAAEQCTTTSDNCSVTIPTSVPTREGYVFKGWANSETATEADFEPEGVITLTADKTVYAVWEAEPAPTPEPEVAVPDTGASTADINAVAISASVIGVFILAMIIGLLPKIAHHKVKFD